MIGTKTDFHFFYLIVRETFPISVGYLSEEFGRVKACKNVRILRSISVNKAGKFTSRSD